VNTRYRTASYSDVIYIAHRSNWARPVTVYRVGNAVHVARVTTGGAVVACSGAMAQRERVAVATVATVTCCDCRARQLAW